MSWDCEVCGATYFEDCDKDEHHIDALQNRVTELEAQLAEAVEVIRQIAATTDYVESESTGSRQYFPTEGAIIARAFLEKVGK